MNRTRAIPQIRVEVEGVAVSADALRALAQVRVQQRLSLPSQCELTFVDPPGPLAPASDWAPGTALRVAVQGQPEPLFQGRVTTVEHVYSPANERALHVRAYDLLHVLSTRRSMRTLVQVSPQDLAEELVGDLGLTVESAAPGVLWRRLVQYRQSHLELLVDAAAQCGQYLYLHEGVLYLLTLEGHGEPLPLQLGDALLEARFEASGEPATRDVTAWGWNPLRVEAVVERVDAPRTGRAVDAEVDPDRLGSDGAYYLGHRTVQDSAHVRALAQAELDRRVAYDVTFWGVAEGNTRLQPGRIVDVRGVAHAFEGRYVLTGVTHTLDAAQGYVAELSTIPPAPAAASGVAPVGIDVGPGVVTRVDDPDNLGRVRVSLPTYDDIETDWMQVLALGAGAQKGLMILPDVGDHVLVLWSQGNPDQGIVLGGLYGMAGFTDSGVEGMAVRRYTLQTPGGQRIQLDDSGHLLRIETEQGSLVELGPDRVRIHAAVDLEIEAPGKSITLRGQAIDFEQG